jgi:hypothetical protein
VLILPLATTRSGGSSREIWGAGFAAFMMTQVGSNSYNGTLLDAYILAADGSDGWTAAEAGKGGLVTIRLAG